MGAYFSKIGSDPYYANYEKSFQRLKKDIDQLNVSSALHYQRLVCPYKSLNCLCVLQVQTETRLKTRKGLAHFIAVWGTLLLIVMVLFAAWVSCSSDTVNAAPLTLRKSSKQQMILEQRPSISQVLRQPEGTYTPQEHALRVSPILIEPLSAYSLHCIIQWLLKIRDKRLTRRLKSLDTKMKRMIHDLKVC